MEIMLADNLLKLVKLFYIIAVGHIVLLPYRFNVCNFCELLQHIFPENAFKVQQGAGSVGS